MGANAAGMTFREVFQNLRERIVKGELSGRIPSLAELRGEYGVSGDTVKKAVALLKEHRFVYGHQGKGVFINQSSEVNPLAQKTVAVFTNEVNVVHPFVMRIVNDMRRLLEKEHCSLIYLNSLSQIAAFKKQFDVLVLCSQFDEGWPEELLALDPGKVISCNCRCLPGGHSVNSNNVLGGYLAAEWLYSKGCRSIGVLGQADIEDETSYIHMRERGAKQFAAEHSDVVVHVESFEPGEAEPYSEEVIGRLFETKPDGIFMTLDMMAFRVYDWCMKHGVRVGKDAQLIGYDNSAYCGQLPPPLSSIREDPEGIASAIVDMTRSILCGNTPSDKKDIPPSVVDRTGDVIQKQSITEKGKK